MTDYQLQVLKKIRDAGAMVFAPKDMTDEALVRFQPQAGEILELVGRKLTSQGEVIKVTKTISFITSIKFNAGLTPEGVRLLAEVARSGRGQRSAILVARERADALLEIISTLNVPEREETEAVRRARTIAVSAVLDLPAI